MYGFLSQHVLHVIAVLYAGLTLLTGGTVGNAQNRYSITQRILIGGQGSWDYMTVDANANRLYLAHQTQVDVVDLATGQLSGSITGLTRCHGILILQEGKTGFISDGGANHVVVFDPATLKIVATIDAGKNPDGMVAEASTGTLWAFNNASSDVTVIDVASRKAIATIAMPGKPEFPATDDLGTIYVNIENKNSIVRVDAKTHTITADWHLKGCDSPSGLAFDRQGNRLFSVCDGKAMAVTDAKTGKSLGVAQIGDEPDAAAYDPKTKLVFASNEDGTLSIVDSSQTGYPTVQTLKTMIGARTMALDSETGDLYTMSAELGDMPKPTPGIAHTRRTPRPGTFTVLKIAR